MYFAVHNSVWEVTCKTSEAEKISQKTEHVPRFHQYFGYLWDCTQSSKFSKKRNVYILLASTNPCI